jgi:hypothetical protein
MLKRNSPGLQSLDELTTETFENCRIVPGNEPTIQTVIVPGLINLYGIIRDNTTHAAVHPFVFFQIRMSTYKPREFLSPASSGPLSPRKRRRLLRESEDNEGEMRLEEFLYRIDLFYGYNNSNNLGIKTEFLTIEENLIVTISSA